MCEPRFSAGRVLGLPKSEPKGNSIYGGGVYIYLFFHFKVYIFIKNIVF